MSNAWGPLGNPTKEEIQKWCELPHGQFTALVKERSRKKRGKTMTEHTVYLLKEVSNLYAAEVKVMAYDWRDAQCRVNGMWEKWKTMEYSTEPVITDQISYSVRSHKNW